MTQRSAFAALIVALVVTGMPEARAADPTNVYQISTTFYCTNFSLTANKTCTLSMMPMPAGSYLTDETINCGITTSAAVSTATPTPRYVRSLVFGSRNTASPSSKPVDAPLVIQPLNSGPEWAEYAVNFQGSIILWSGHQPFLRITVGPATNAAMACTVSGRLAS